MIADARDLESGFELECDVCIVGTGAAGLTLGDEVFADIQAVYRRHPIPF